MLVLTRGRRQSLRIGTEVIITVLSVGDRSVRIGIEAPQHVRLQREEMVGRRRGPASAGIARSRRG